MKKLYVYTANDGPYATKPVRDDATISNEVYYIRKDEGFFFHNPTAHPGFIPWNAIVLIRLVDEPE